MTLELFNFFGNKSELNKKMVMVVVVAGGKV
jgi:hypothetical protein